MLPLPFSRTRPTAPVEARRLDELFRRYGPMVHRQARRMMPTADDAKDVLQDVFVRLLQVEASRLSRPDVSSFIYRITFNLCLNRIRDDRRRSQLLSARELEQGFIDSPESRVELLQVLRSADPREALAFTCVRLEGMNHEEARAWSVALHGPFAHSFNGSTRTLGESSATSKIERNAVMADCPSMHTLSRYCSGERVPRHSEVEQHVHSCAACQQRWREVESSFEPLWQDRYILFQSILQRAQRESALSAQPMRSKPAAAPWWIAMVAAAGGLLVSFGGAESTGSGSRSKGATFTAEVFREHHDEVSVVLPDTPIVEGDRLMFRVTSANPGYLVVVGVEADGSVFDYADAEGHALRIPAGPYEVPFAARLDESSGDELIRFIRCPSPFTTDAAHRREARARMRRHRHPGPQGGHPMMKRVTSCIVLWFGLLTAGEEVASGATHVIAIGANRGIGTETVLKYAERDAELIRETMISLGGADFVDVLRSPTATEVEKLLEEVELRLASSIDPSHEKLVVYYSGHADNDGLHLSGSVLPFERLRRRLEDSQAKLRLLILDACRAGNAIRKKGATRAEPFAIRLDSGADMAGLAIMASSAGFEESFESDRLGGSVFTHHLVQGLRGAADSDLDLRVTLHEAYIYAYRQTLQSTGLMVERQSPTYEVDLSGRGEVVLSHLAEPTRFRLQDPGSYLFFDDGDRLVAEVRVLERNTPFVAASGRYRILHRDDDGAATEIGVELPRGEERIVRAADGTMRVDIDGGGRSKKGARAGVHAMSALASVRGPRDLRSRPSDRSRAGLALRPVFLARGL
ncbi:MAG: hypothetical protein HC923_13245 [Myxococcales bacterium]|nr:hypothetical protein [Myxococcales bacterium]